MKVFDILESIKELEAMINATDDDGVAIFDENSIQEFLEAINEEKNIKLESIEYLKRQNKSDAELLATEIKRLQSKKKAIDNTNERLKELQNLLLNGEKTKTDKFTFSYRYTKSVEIDSAFDVSSLPLELYTTKFTADKTAIKKELEKGWSVDGVSLVENIGLSVR